MDLSKLPRLSKTDRPGGDAQAEGPDDGAAQPPDYPVQASAVIGAEAWISIAMGIILILFAPRIWQYFLSPGSFTWTFQDKQGNPLAYAKSAFFLADLGLALLALVLIADGLLLVLRRFRMLLAIGFSLTALCVAFNLLAMVWVMKEIGVQLMSVIAVVLGIYIGIYQWNQLRVMFK